eukprot:scaffold7460_cov33-Tisochrysis_lutea.AAC.2
MVAESDVALPPLGRETLSTSACAHGAATSAAVSRPNLPSASIAYCSKVSQCGIGPTFEWLPRGRARGRSV